MSDDNIIDLRLGQKKEKRRDEFVLKEDVGHKPEFKIDHVDEPHVKHYEYPEDDKVGHVHSSPISDMEISALKSSDKVKVKFDKFVNLVMTHAYEDIVEKYMDENVIIGTDLLTDLASTHEEKSSRKTPLFFLIGIILGLGVAWFLLK